MKGKEDLILNTRMHVLYASTFKKRQAFKLSQP